MRETELRDNPQCTFCEHPATIIDHIKPIEAGGAKYDPKNRRPVCRDCHAILTGNYRKYGVNEMTVEGK